MVSVIQRTRITERIARHAGRLGGWGERARETMVKIKTAMTGHSRPGFVG
jgi:hypothetical protein